MNNFIKIVKNIFTYLSMAKTLVKTLKDTSLTPGKKRESALSDLKSSTKTNGITLTDSMARFIIELAYQLVKE